MRTLHERSATIENLLDGIPQVELYIRHYFAPGMFAREMTVPQGVCVVGMIHKIVNLAILSSGGLRILNEDGFVDIFAPWQGTMFPGQKNAAISLLGDAVWTNFYPNPDNETDINVLIPRYYEGEANELIGGRENHQLIVNSYREAISKNGYDEETVNRISHDLSDQSDIDMLDKIEIQPSKIEGFGIFAKQDIHPGEFIAPMRINEKRCLAGRKTNHHPYPNAEAVLKDNNDMNLHAIEFIKKGREITTDYDKTLRLRL